MKKKKHISLIYEFLSEEGGLEREIINHANFLIEEGYEVDILTCYLDKNILKVLPFNKIPIKVISLFKTSSESINLIFSFLGFNNLKKHNPDLFISYSAPSNFLIRNKKIKKIFYINHYPHFLYEKNKIEWAKSTKGSKRIISVILSFFFGFFLKKIDKKLLEKNDINFVNSGFTKRRLEKIYNANFIISYPPIDPKFKPSKRKINEKFIFSPSRIIPDKKYDWLIKSLKFMKNKIPLYIAGAVKESYRKELVNLAEKNKIIVKFVGKLNTEQMRDYYTNALVVVFPAPQEDFGLVPAESLACGTPVVAWNDGAGPSEQIINGINGYLARPYDLKDFEKKIDLCIYNNLKKRNKKKIINSSKKFSAEIIKKDFIKKIKNLLDD
ncbi:MAG: glycosyltransferase family 4 protein [Candidatus Methanomethylicia archaeon]